MIVHPYEIEDGYLIIDDFLENENAKSLHKELKNINYYKKSKGYWPPNLYTYFGGEDTAKEIGDVEISGEFLWNKSEGEVFPSSTPDLDSYSDEFLNLMSIFQNTLLNTFDDLKIIDENGIDSLERVVTMPYKWPPNSSILWHDDGFHSFGTSYYMNSNWDPNCGGELMFGEGTWIYPKFNRLVIIFNKINHKVNHIVENCEDRYSLQTFCRIN